MKRFLFVALSVVALGILVQPAALQAQGKAKAEKAKTMNASGTVKSVSGNSLTITAAGGKDMSFSIDNTTKFVGKGLSTKTAQKGKLTATDAVGMNDRVTVTYHDMAGSMHAATVQITTKVAKK